MDFQTKLDIDSMTRWAAYASGYDRLETRRTQERKPCSWWRFWFSPMQVVDEPVAAELTSEATAFVSEVGPGEAGSEPQTAVFHTPANPRFAGPAGPTTPTVRPVRGAGPATPHHA